MIRGFASSTLAIFVALAGHVSGGGQMPGPLGILVPWILSLAVCVVLAGRRLSLIRLALSVGASQFLFHVLFVLGTVTPSGMTAPAHVHGGPLVLPAGGGVTDAVVADGSMWAAHLLAALLTIAALHRGERLVHALRGLAGRAVQWLRRRVDIASWFLPVRGPLRLRGEFRVAAAAASAHLTALRDRAPPVPLAI